MQNLWSYSGPTELNSTFKNMPKRFLDTLKAEKRSLDTFDFVVVLLPILLSVFPLSPLGMQSYLKFSSPYHEPYLDRINIPFDGTFLTSRQPDYQLLYFLPGVEERPNCLSCFK